MIGELRLAGVTRRFGDQAALDGLDLTIRGGEFIALLGPSGCGKTTALNCLAGLLPLSGGEIHLDGDRIDGLPPERRGFGMVFQNYALFPHLSVRRNVAFGLEMAGTGKQERAGKVDEVLDLVGLQPHAEKYPAQLSGGQQQRVAIARAVVMEPPLMLMDEPLSNLDAKLRLEMRTEIRRLHQQLDLTTVYVTHDQEEALSLADRLVLLRDGVVEQVGPPEELYPQPASAYVAGFMGYRNLLEMEVDGARQRPRQRRRQRPEAPRHRPPRRLRQARDLRDPTRGPAPGRGPERGPGEGRRRRVPRPGARRGGRHRAGHGAAPADR